MAKDVRQSPDFTNATSSARGKVCLVGSGPGDPELLTVKAVNRLRRADIVLHDALVSPEVLALASPTARAINVGKRCGRKCITQLEINTLMITFAEQGKFVVRLKSGDPLVFGRAGEEIDALNQAGIVVEVVPGITAAVAAAAATQISLTDRRCAEEVRLISAHQASDKAEADWPRLSSSRTTIVVYMPGQPKRVAERLIRAGLAAETPCVIISRVSRPEEQHYETTLAGLGQAPSLPPPSLLIVGKTTATVQAKESQLVLHQLAQTVS